ncbi:MAG: ACP S-malonyltransferase, partial [Burkholderiales bacterium]
GVAVFRAWTDAGGVLPEALAGHSLGEYSALVAAGSMTFSAAVPLVRFRAQCMHEAVPAGVGAMAAVLGLDDDGVRAACAEASEGDEIAEAANFNAPGQVVVAGRKAAVERAVEAARVRGAKRAMLLAMSTPSHCTLMKPASERLAVELDKLDIQMPAPPVIHNESVSAASNTDELRDALVRQLYQPVRWVETIRSLIDSGVTHIVECGPGRVLAGLNKRIGGDVQTIALVDANSITEAMATVKGGQ